MRELWIYWCYWVGLVLVMYMLGRCLLWGIGIHLRGYTQIFAALLIAPLALTTVFALIMTTTKTVFMMVLVVLVLMFVSFSYSSKKTTHPRPPTVATWQTVAILLVSSLFCYLPNALMLIKFNGKFPYYIPTQDLVGYSNYVKQLLLTRQENYNGLTANLITNYFHGISPYHFYELWLAALLVQVTQVLPVFAYWLWVYPLFYLTTWAGLMAIWEYYNTKNIHQKALLSYALLLVGGIYLPIADYLPYLDTTVYLHNNTLLTYGLIEPFLVLVFLLWRHQYYLLTVYTLLLLPLLSITTLAGVFGGIFGMMWWAYDCRQHHLLYTIAITILGYLLGLMFLYATWGTQNEAAFSWKELTPIVSTQLYTFPKNLYWIVKQFITVFGLYLGKSIWVYLPYGIGIGGYCYLQQSHNNIKTNLHRFKYLFFIPLCGLSAMLLVILHHDASQVFRNFCFPVLNGCIVLYIISNLATTSLANSYLPKTTYYYLIHIYWSSLFVYQIGYTTYTKWLQVTERQTISDDELVRLSQYFAQLPPNTLGGFLLSPNFYQDDLFTKVVRHHLPAGYLVFFPQVIGIVNLGVFEIPPSRYPTYQLQLPRLRANSEFYQYAHRMRATHPSLSIATIQKQFVKEYGIGFLLLDNYRIPATLLVPQNYTSVSLRDNTQLLFIKKK